ncbi:hypothetical protein ZWY2020_028127 [Hordeum vulgare]|nr:hypothetical protein ZWY2020_028127 [Hordeum vulgare]
MDRWAWCVCDMEAPAVGGGGLDLLPLHTVVASARLKSCIAVDSTCWCSLSQVSREEPGTVAFASSVQGLHFSTNQQPTNK